MRTKVFADAGILLLLTTKVTAHKGVHEHLELLHRKHHEQRSKRVNQTGIEEIQQDLIKRDGQCTFPTDAGLVAVTPGSSNAGWAMSPNQPCTPGNYCPYACPPGQVSEQWDPSATSYTYPLSMNGGLYCDENGNIQKPFPNKPYCQQTATNIGVVNNAGSVVSFCQTVLPGNEAMLIPTAVENYATLAVPDPSYWAGTAAHYYINPPGIDPTTACVWGTNANPWGNWSPYVAGANSDASGNTYIKLGWNPIMLEPTCAFRNVMPTWGVEIECPNGGCNGLPCAIDPSKNSVNEMVGSATDGAGGGAFCVVTVAQGSTANFVITGSGGSNNAQGGQFYQSGSSAAATTAVSSASTPSSASWSAWAASNDTATASNGWGAANGTSTSYSAPTGEPYGSLFNDTAPSTTSPQAANAAMTATGSIAPSSLPAKGDASRIDISMTGFVLFVVTLLHL